MKNTFVLIAISMFILTSVSCKSDAKTDKEKTTVNPISENKKAIPPKTDMSKSVMVQTMTTRELSTLASALVGAGLATELMNTSNKVTLLAPSNEAFKGMSKELVAKYKNLKNKEEYSTVLKNHMIQGVFSSADLLQSIKPTGSYVIKTVGGAELTATLREGSIVITDAQGDEAIIGKSDINADNGSIHIINTVLTTSVK